MEKAARKRTPRKKQAYIPPNLTEWRDIDAVAYQKDPERYRINGRRVTSGERVLISIRHGLGHVCSDELALAIYAELDDPDRGAAS